MNLAITTSEIEKGIILVEIEGKMNALTNGELKTMFKKLISENSAQIIVNLEKVDFIDSSGLSILIAALKNCREKGGYLRVCNLQKNVRKIFELTMLDRVFDISASLESALQKE